MGGMCKAAATYLISKCISFHADLFWLHVNQYLKLNLDTGITVQRSFLFAIIKLKMYYN